MIDFLKVVAPNVLLPLPFGIVLGIITVITESVSDKIREGSREMVIHPFLQMSSSGKWFLVDSASMVLLRP